MQIKSWKLSSSEWLSSIMSALVMSVRAITPNGIKKNKKNNFRKLFLLVDSFLTLLDIKKRRRRWQRLRWMSEWRRYMGDNETLCQKWKKEFSSCSLFSSTKGRLISALHKIYSNYGYYIVDFISYPTSSLYFCFVLVVVISVRERKAQFLVVSWAYKGETLSDGEGSLLRLRWTFTQPSQLSSVNIYSHFHRGEHFIKISTIFSLRS